SPNDSTWAWCGDTTAANGAPTSSIGGDAPATRGRGGSTQLSIGTVRVAWPPPTVVRSSLIVHGLPRAASGSWTIVAKLPSPSTAPGHAWRLAASDAPAGA